MSNREDATSALISLLWIDNDTASQDLSLDFLRASGFSVDCAESGSVGLALSRAHAYDAVLLDLFLPDRDGFSVLRELQAAPVSSPVVVVTWHGDVDSVVTAMRLGAVDFRLKPLSGEDLVRAVRAAVACRSARAVEGSPLESLAAALNRLCCGRVIATRGEQDYTSLTASRVAKLLLPSVVDTVVSEALSTEAVPHCLVMLNRVLAPADEAPTDLVSELRGLITRAVQASGESDVLHVSPALSCLQASLAKGSRISERQLGKELGIDPVYLGKLLRLHTGRGFRRWRQTLAVRLAVRELAATRERQQIAQVAYSLGYQHASQLDRDFQQALGISPRRFRGLAGLRSQGDTRAKW